ncbi:hypothetical protein [Variovorax sp. 3P27G3]|jgi:hypothetical protein|uniref:hypothetical protein n=1 Tax=Variovorax sp. 3P27G3 TaxID=2502214 RepID=UPI0010F641F1|nr:hypothetical protein [Variovorax sp. 3P27G3]
MKPDLSDSGFDALQRQNDRLTRSTRTIYGLEPYDDMPSTPFDWLSTTAVLAIEVFVIAVAIVVILALALSSGGATA